MVWYVVPAFPGRCDSLARGKVLVAQACKRLAQLPENAAVSPMNATAAALCSAPNPKAVALASRLQTMDHVTQSSRPEASIPKD